MAPWVRFSAVTEPRLPALTLAPRPRAPARRMRLTEAARRRWIDRPPEQASLDSSRRNTRWRATRSPRLPAPRVRAEAGARRFGLAAQRSGPVRALAVASQSPVARAKGPKRHAAPAPVRWVRVVR